MKEGIGHVLYVFACLAPWFLFIGLVSALSGWWLLLPLAALIVWIRVWWRLSRAGDDNVELIDHPDDARWYQ